MTEEAQGGAKRRAPHEASGCRAKSSTDHVSLVRPRSVPAVYSLLSCLVLFCRTPRSRRSFRSQQSPLLSTTLWR
jgi:hypothetical protein